MRLLAAVCFLTVLAVSGQAAGALRVYVIDMEGGNGKLIVAPSGESMLIDAGWPGNGGRDVDRIAAAAQAAGVKQIDHLVITHLDVDHVGDLAALAARIPVKHVYDNGPLQTSGKGVEKRYEIYAAVRDKMEHSILKPGDVVKMGDVEASVVSAATKVIDKPLAGAGAVNPACGAMPQPAEIAGDLEDNMSIGLLFTYGRFRMLDLSDLEGHYSYPLACPNNLIGSVDVYQVPVHGQAKGSAPALEQAIKARVAIMNNGAKKGGDVATWPVLRAAPGLEDIWQVHFSVAGGKENNPPDDFIANLEPVNCGASSITLSAARDGSFTVTNTRNGFSQNYAARK